METYEKLCTDFRALSYEYPLTTSAHAQFPAVKNGFHLFQLLNTPLSVGERVAGIMSKLATFNNKTREK